MMLEVRIVGVDPLQPELVVNDVHKPRLWGEALDLRQEGRPLQLPEDASILGFEDALCPGVQGISPW